MPRIAYTLRIKSTKQGGMHGVRAGAENAIKRQTIIQQWNKCESTAFVTVSEPRVRLQAATMQSLESHWTVCRYS